MIEFFVPGKPRQRGSKTAIPIRNKDGTVRMTPTASGKKRVVMRYVDAAKGSGKWKETVASAAMEVAPKEPWDCPVTVFAAFLYCRPDTHYSKRTGELLPSAPIHKATIPDADKLTRAIFDAMNKVIYRDDGRVVSLKVEKAWSHSHEGVLVQAWPDAVRMDFDGEVDRILKKQEAAKPF